MSFAPCLPSRPLILSNENRIKYKFIQRLTVGKVKLFCEVFKQTGSGIGTPGQLGSVPSYYSEDKIYYISIYDSKLETNFIKFLLCLISSFLKALLILGRV